MAQQTDSDSDVLFDRVGSAAVITLNRPKALNSVNLAMVRGLALKLGEFGEDEGVSCVIIRGEGERAFCAGGDIRAIHALGRQGDAGAAGFFREEFRLVAQIARFPKPYVALMDGITMGGGIGLSAHGSHRVATERSRLAMPETGIGYVPDVGSSFLLAKAPGETGSWIGLTGQDFSAADGLHAGLADAFVSSQRLEALTQSLGMLPPSAGHGDVSAVIDGFRVDAGQSLLAANAALISRCFRFDAVEDIVAALQAESGDFAEETLAVLRRRSPLSLKLSLRLLREARRSSGLEACLELEFTLAAAILEGHDFYEGVRAAVIDKDRNPQWRPASLDAVDDAEVARHFMPLMPPLF